MHTDFTCYVVYWFEYKSHHYSLFDHRRCSWYRNYTRTNFPFGDYDPAGIACAPDQAEIPLLRNDDELVLAKLFVNFRGELG